MRPSKYVSIVPDYPSVGQHMMFNWLTQAMGVVDDDVRNIIGADFFDSSMLPDEMVTQLEAMGMIVQDDADERETIERWHEDVRGSRRTFKAMVMTTYDCNFACSYCVEEGVKRPQKLDDEQARRIVDWIIERMEEQGSERLYLNFYGGEPLMNVAALERVAAPLLAYTQKHDLEFDGSVTTNGALLNRKSAQRLASVGVTRAKVTIDGDKETHDTQRPFKGGHGSFDIIMKNVQQVCDVIDVRLAGNLDCQGVHTVPRLLDYLEEHGLSDKIIGLHFNSISGQARDGFDSPGCSTPTGYGNPDLLQIRPADVASNISSGEPDVSELLLEANLEVERRGLPARRSIGASLCLLNQAENAVVIDPLGKIYKCPALVGHEPFIVGDVDTAQLQLEHLRMHEDEKDECLDCKWFPVCGGGCRFISFLETGDIRHKDCHKPFFDEHGDDMVKMDHEIYEQEHAED